MPKPSNYSGGSSSARRKPAVRGGKSRSSGRGSGTGAAKLLLGVAIGVVLSAVSAASYFYFGHPAVAVTDKPAIWEHLTATVSLHRRVEAEAKQPPFSASEDGFEAAAKIYRTQCAQCHGAPGHESQLGRGMLPRAQQFFGRDSKATAAKPAGQIFWVTNYGVRRSGMPAYARTLANADLWNLALLLHSADQELPDPVKNLLAPTIPSTAPTAAAPSR